MKRTAVTYRLFHCKSKTVKSYKFWQKWWCMWRTFTAYRTHIMTCVQECVLYTIISYSQERILFWALSGALMPPATYHPNQITVQTRHIEIEPSAVYASIYLNSVYPAGAHNISCLNPKAVSIWCNIRLVSAYSSYLNHKNPLMTLPDNRAAARYRKTTAY